ncbi:MAG: hypothetical protein ABEH43_07350 [Flavobacteriales bacterium]
MRFNFFIFLFTSFFYCLVFFPSSLASQTKDVGKLKRNNNIILGFPLIPNWAGPSTNRFILELSYQRKIGPFYASFSIIGGPGFNPNIPSFKFNKGRYFLFVSGVKRRVWQLGTIFTLNLGADFIYSYENNVLDLNNYKYNDEYHFLGVGSELNNVFHLSSCHSLGLNVRLEIFGYIKYCESVARMNHSTCYKFNMRFLGFLQNQSFNDKASLYDGINVFYRYNF